MNVRARRLLGVAVLAAAALPASAFGSGFPIANTAYAEYSADVAFDGTNFLVSVQESHLPDPSITGAKLVSPAGVVLATVWAPTGDAPNISFDGTNYLLVWADHSSGGTVRVHGLLVSKAGSAVGSPFFVSQSTTVSEVTGVAFDGTNYLVVWTDMRRVVDPPEPGDKDIYGRLVSTAGAPVASDFKISGVSGVSASVAFAAPNYLVAWTEDVANLEVHARLVTPAGVLQGEFTVNGSAYATDNLVKVATDGTNFLVVWSDEVSTDNWELFGQLVSPSATLVGSVITIAAIPGPQLAPYIAFDGVNFLVTWSDFRNDVNGNFACDVGEGLCIEIGGQFVSASGALVGGNFPVTADAGAQAQSPTVYGAGRYFVVWTHEFQTPSADVFGTFVPIDLIFRDGFESGTLSAWSAASVGGGDLSLNSVTPLVGSFDIKGVVNDTNPLYVEDHSPLDEEHYRARFRFDPNDFDPGTAQSHFRTRIFIALEEGPNRRLAAVVLRKLGGQFSLMGRTHRDDGSHTGTGFFNLAPGPHLVEVEWKRATSAVSADGEFRLWIDDTLMSALTALQNNVSSVDFARLGALSVKAGANGTLYWDDFESRRATYIGP
jgi:hypothetical protein